MRLLIIKPSSLGDIVHALVAVQSLKEQKPEARISWVVREEFAPFLVSIPFVDKIIPYDRKGGLRGFLRLLKEIGEERYDAVLDMQGLLRSGIMMMAARAPLKIGRSDGREGAPLFANRSAKMPEKSRHAVDILMEFLPALGLEKQYRPIKLKPDASAPKLPKGAVLIFPSARGDWANKEWPYFKELTEALIKDGKTVAWCDGKPGETPIPSGGLDYRGKVPLQNLFAFIAQAKVVVSNDSGPMHMAAALGVPVVGLFGPTDPKLTGPYPPESPQNRFLKSPSGKMEDISHKKVLDLVREILSL